MIWINKKRGTAGRVSQRAPQVSQGGLVTSLHYEQPLVAPQVLHFMQVPLRTKVKFPQSPHGSPSYPLIRASRT